MSHDFDLIFVSASSYPSHKTKTTESNQKNSAVAIYAIITRGVDCRDRAWFSYCRQPRLL